MRTLRTLAPAFLFAFVAAAQETPRPDPGPSVPVRILGAPFPVEVDAVEEDLAFLASDAMRGRAAGSAEGKKAGAFVAARFEALGLEPAGDDGTFLQGFDIMTVRAVPKEGGEDGETAYAFEKEKARCHNVLAWLPGSDEDLAEEYLVVGAHYDHVGVRGGEVYNGADDNASGTAGLLAIAAAMAADDAPKPRRSVLFAAFDAEERGLRGAQHFVRHPPRTLQRCVAMVNIDMIGRGRLMDRKEMKFAKKLMGVPEGIAVGVLGPGSSPDLGRIARAVFGADELPLFAPSDFGMLAEVIKKQAAGRADHAPFEQRKIPFLFFSNSEHDDYHRPTDTLETVDPAAVHRIARAIHRTVLGIDALDQRPEFVADGK